MKSRAKNNSNLSVPDWAGTDKQNSQSDVCKLVIEGMVTIILVLVFMFIAQNWVLTNEDGTSYTPTCSLTEGRVGIGVPISCEANKTIDGYELVLQ